jgi:peptidyl-prolyl cis-trans isomerase C
MLFTLACGKGKPAGEGSPGAMVARVNGEEIREGDVTREVAHLAAVMGPSAAQAQTDPAQMAQLRSNAIQNLVDRSLLLARAKEENLTPTDDEVMGELEKVRSQYADTSAFTAKLASLSMTEADVQNELRMNLCLRRLVEKSAASLPAATAEEAEKYYRENPTQFESPEEIRASHILVRAAETDPADARAAAKTKAEGLAAQARGGADFGEMAKANSGDPGSAANGGDLGYFARGRMVPPFEQAAFALKVGEVSGVVETPYGYHIIKVTDRREARTLPLDEVRDKIVQYLERTRGDRAIRTILDEARAKAKIERLDEPGKG